MTNSKVCVIIEAEVIEIKDILSILGFQYICNAIDVIHDGDNDLSKFNAFSGKKGIFVFTTENNEILYVGRSNNLKERIGQCLRKENDSGSIFSVEQLTENEYVRICHANIYVLPLKDDDFKKSISSYSVFRKEKK